MGRPSSVDKLDPTIRAEINRLKIERGFTIDQIVEHMKTMGVTTISRSAMGRHVKKLEEVGARIREARAVAEGIAPTLAGKDDGQLLNMNVELLHGAIMRMASATDEEGEDVQLKPSEAMAIGKALECASKAAAINANRVLKIKQEAAKETAKKAAEVVQKALETDAPGLSAGTVDKIMHQVLGVAKT
jgi:hypothetical protein